MGSILLNPMLRDCHSTAFSYQNLTLRTFVSPYHLPSTLVYMYKGMFSEASKKKNADNFVEELVLGWEISHTQLSANNLNIYSSPEFFGLTAARDLSLTLCSFNEQTCWPFPFQTP